MISLLTHLNQPPGPFLDSIYTDRLDIHKHISFENDAHKHIYTLELSLRTNALSVRVSIFALLFFFLQPKDAKFPWVTCGRNERINSHPQTAEKVESPSSVASFHSFITSLLQPLTLLIIKDGQRRKSTPGPACLRRAQARCRCPSRKAPYRIGCRFEAWHWW